MHPPPTPPKLDYARPSAQHPPTDHQFLMLGAILTALGLAIIVLMLIEEALAPILIAGAFFVPGLWLIRDSVARLKRPPS